MSEEQAVSEPDVSADYDQEDMLSTWMQAEGLSDSEETPAEDETPQEEEAQEPVAEGEKKPASPEEKQAEKAEPKGFGSRFYKADEKTGELRWDNDEALSFLLPKDKKNLFEHPGRKFAESKQEQGPKRDPWEEEYESIEKQKQEIRSTKLTYRNHLAEGLKMYGNDFAKAADYADSKVNEELLAAEKKIDFDFRKKEYGGFQTQKEKDATIAKASSNEHAIINSRFKDHKEYAELMYNFGAPIINTLFDLANPNAADPRSKEEWAESMNSFWHGIMADREKGERVVNMVLGAWTLQNLPSIVGKAVNETESQTRKNIRGALRKPSGLKASASERSEGGANPEEEAWTKYMGRNPFGGVPEV